MKNPTYYFLLLWIMIVAYLMTMWIVEVNRADKHWKDYHMPYYKDTVTSVFRVEPLDTGQGHCGFRVEPVDTSATHFGHVVEFQMTRDSTRMAYNSLRNHDYVTHETIKPTIWKSFIQVPGRRYKTFLNRSTTLLVCPTIVKPIDSIWKSYEIKNSADSVFEKYDFIIEYNNEMVAYKKSGGPTVVLDAVKAVDAMTIVYIEEVKKR